MFLIVDFRGQVVHVKRVLEPSDIQMIRNDRLMCFKFDGSLHRYQYAVIETDERSFKVKWQEMEIS